MMAKFCGAFLGGVSVSRNLKRSLLVGMFAGAVGFGGFAVAPGMALGAVALFVGGYGIGQLITATNILAGRRFTAHRGSALSLLNFSFSLGAMLSALLAAWLLPRFALRSLLECFAVTFLLGGLVLVLEMRGAAGRRVRSDPLRRPTARKGSSGRIYLYFAGLLFLYGGLETCLSGWLTTFALRYGTKTLAGQRVHDAAALDVVDGGARWGFGDHAARGREDSAALGAGVGGGIYGGDWRSRIRP